MKRIVLTLAMLSSLLLTGCDQTSPPPHPLKNGPHILTDEIGNKWFVQWRYHNNDYRWEIEPYNAPLPTIQAPTK